MRTIIGVTIAQKTSGCSFISWIILFSTSGSNKLSGGNWQLTNTCLPLLAAAKQNHNFSNKRINTISKYQVVKFSPGGSLPRSSSLPLTPPSPLLLPEAQKASKAPKAPEAGPRLPEAPGRSQWLRGQGGVRGKGSKAPESDWRPMAAKGFQRLTRLPEAPGRSQGPREAQGVRGVRGARPLSLTEDPRLPKASEGSQGFLRPQEGPRGPERLRGWGGVRGSKGVGEQGPWVWLKT